MSRKVAEYDYIARREGRRQHLLDISSEDLASHRPVHDERRDDPNLSQACHKGGQPMSMRHRIDDPPPARCPAVTAGHVRGGSGLVEEDKAAALLGYIRSVLLGRPKCLFCASGPCARA
jgi:hypothetical protein